MTNKMTFGFRQLNGAAFQIKLESTPTGRFPSPRTIGGIRSFVIKEMNKSGREAQRIAREPGHAPFLTGALVRSIKWRKARQGRGLSGVITGALTVGVPYGRRQEFEHPTRSLYLQRALQQVFPDFVARLRNRRVLGDILFSRRFQSSGGGVTGGFF